MHKISSSSNFWKGKPYYHDQGMIKKTAENNGCKDIEGELGTETEAERQLKVLLDKQLDTSFTLQKQFDQHRTFKSSTHYTPLTEAVSGTHSLEEFLITEDDEERRAELRHCDLTENEIDLYLYSNYSNVQTSKKLHLSIEPEALKQRLESIEEKLKLHKESLSQPLPFSGVKQLSRHEMDIEKSLYAGCETKQQLKSLVATASSYPDSQLFNDPFAHIKHLSKKLFEKVRTGKRKHYINISNLDSDSPHPIYESVYNKTDKDATTITDASDKQLEDHDPAIYHAIVPLSEEEITENKLTVSEIKQLARFQNYSSGEPNKILYLKNLHSKVHVGELIALFGKYDLPNKEPVKYRLLTGKMRGQAFVTFADTNIAEEAFNLINGYILRGQPIIIQYGRKK